MKAETTNFLKFSDSKQTEVEKQPKELEEAGTSAKSNEIDQERIQALETSNKSLISHIERLEMKQALFKLNFCHPKIIQILLSIQPPPYIRIIL